MNLTTDIKTKVVWAASPQSPEPGRPRGLAAFRERKSNRVFREEEGTGNG